MPARRQVTVQIGQLLVKGERAFAPHCQHPNEFPITQANEIGVLAVKLIHQSLGGRTLVLRNLLNESLVVEPMNGFELPILRSEFENQRLAFFHRHTSCLSKLLNQLLCAEVADLYLPRRHPCKTL